MKIKRILIVAGSIFLVIAICLIAFEIKEYIDYEEYVFVDKVYSTIELGKSNYTINNDSNFGYFYNNGKVTIDDISDDILIEVTLKKLSKYKENDFRISKYNLNKEIYKIFNKRVYAFPKTAINNFLCSENGNYYECYKGDEGDCAASGYVKDKLDWTKDEDKLIIYERAYYYEGLLDEDDTKYFNLTVYDNDLSKNILLTKKGLVDGFNPYITDDAIYKNSNLIYKWTYKKINGKYYFQSVERDDSYEF